MTKKKLRVSSKITSPVRLHEISCIDHHRMKSNRFNFPTLVCQEAATGGVLKEGALRRKIHRKTP